MSLFTNDINSKLPDQPKAHNRSIDFSKYFKTCTHSSNAISEDSGNSFMQFFRAQCSVMLVISAEDGSVIEANPSAVEFYGYSREQFRLLNITELHKNSKFDISWPVGLAASTGKHSTVSTHRLSDGSLRVVEIFSSPLAYQNKDTFSLIIHDITPQAKAEDSTKGNDEYLKYFANRTDLVCWLSENGLIYMNDNFVHLTGISNDNLDEIPALLLKLVHPDDKASVCRNLFSRKINAEEVVNFNFRIIRANYEIRWINSLSYDVYETGSNRKMRAGIAKDITEIKHFENCLADAKEQSLESDRLKTAFLNNLNHEIRTPMNGIIGFSEILKLPDLTVEKRNYYTSIIIEQSKKLLSIINDIIRASKTDTYAIGFKKKRFSLNELLKETFEHYKNQHETDSLKFSLLLGLEEEESQIYSGKEQLAQILNYLLSNAVKFTSTGRIELAYKLSNSKLLISVEDTGIGIDKKHHESVFAMFRQVELSLDKSHGGNGLGLSISKKLVNYLEGEIWLNSELKKGTTVYFTIPYIRDY